MSKKTKQIKFTKWQMFIMWRDVHKDSIKDWFQRVWYCHHNARVLADMEYRFGCVLNQVTDGMSKAYYTQEAMDAEIQQHQNKLYSDGYDDGVAETKAESEAT